MMEILHKWINKKDKLYVKKENNCVIW